MATGCPLCVNPGMHLEEFKAGSHALYPLEDHHIYHIGISLCILESKLGEFRKSNTPENITVETLMLVILVLQSIREMEPAWFGHPYIFLIYFI